MNREMIISKIQNTKITRCLYVLSGAFQKIPTIPGMIASENSIFYLGEEEPILSFIKKYSSFIESYDSYLLCKNSAYPLFYGTNSKIRIEPGAILREDVQIGENSIFLMGCVVNAGARIGKNCMIDMNSVIGSCAIIGDFVHIGAGAVIAGVLEPISKKEVVIEEGAFIGANSVILEGVHIGKKAIVGAGSVVTRDVLSGTIVMGNPARFYRYVDSIDEENIYEKNIH